MAGLVSGAGAVVTGAFGGAVVVTAVGRVVGVDDGSVGGGETVGSLVGAVGAEMICAALGWTATKEIAAAAMQARGTLSGRAPAAGRARFERRR